MQKATCSRCLGSAMLLGGKVVAHRVWTPDMERSITCPGSGEPPWTEPVRQERILLHRCEGRPLGRAWPRPPWSPAPALVAGCFSHALCDTQGTCRASEARRAIKREALHG